MSRPGVVVELRGRLGNQLFQYACGSALAAAHDCSVAWTAGVLQRRRDVILPAFVPSAREAVPRELHRVATIGSGSDGRGMVRSSVALAMGRAVEMVGRAGGRPLLAAPRSISAFDPAVLQARPPCLLRGWFQNEHYFAAHADAVEQSIVLPDPRLPDDLPRPAVGLLFRRGDYNASRDALSLEYYERALHELCREVDVASVVVQADDAAFARLAVDWLARFVPTVVDGTASAPGAHEAMAMMASCDHWIVANSTFAWWCAWLGERRRRRDGARAIVLAPQRWYRGEDDVVPPRWRRVAP